MMIDVNHVYKNFGRKHILQDVSCSIKKGEITALVGINGVGKTTLLNMIMGLTPVTKGNIRIDDAPVNKDIYEKVSFIPDALTMLPRMTIQQAMAFMKDFYQSWNEEKAADILSFFSLDKKQRIAQLSKGNKAKLNLLLGLALDVDYVLMDEPFSGIDIFSREQITDVFTSELVEDKGVLVTTHEVYDIEYLLDQVIILDEGRVLQTFAADDIRMKEGKSVIDIMREVLKP